jgi:DDE_Tnp_1-associated
MKISFAKTSNPLAKDNKMNKTHCNAKNPTCPENIEVGIWIRFLRGLGLQKLFSILPDPRRETHTRYSLSTLIMWAFSACTFRLSSKHAMQTSLEYLPQASSEGISQLIGSHEIPHSSTVDQALAKIDYDHFNQLYLQLFDQLNKKKLFL